jgi:hypothetical protein
MLLDLPMRLLLKFSQRSRRATCAFPSEMAPIKVGRCSIEEECLSGFIGDKRARFVTNETTKPAHFLSAASQRDAWQENLLRKMRIAQSGEA